MRAMAMIDSSTMKGACPWSGGDGAFGVVLVRLWVAEIRQYPVAAEPRDLAGVFVQSRRCSTHADRPGEGPPSLRGPTATPAPSTLPGPQTGSSIAAARRPGSRSLQFFRPRVPAFPGRPAQPYLNRMQGRRRSPIVSPRSLRSSSVRCLSVSRSMSWSVRRGAILKPPPAQPRDHVRHRLTCPSVWRARHLARQCACRAPAHEKRTALSLYQRGFNGHLSFGAITVDLYFISNEYSLPGWRLRGPLVPHRQNAITQLAFGPPAGRQPDEGRAMNTKVEQIEASAPK